MSILRESARPPGNPPRAAWRRRARACAAVLSLLGLGQGLGAAPMAELMADFSNGPATSYSGLIQAPDGSFYGTSYDGGTLENGTVFRLAPDGALTTLVNFVYFGTVNGGARPLGSLIRGTDGNYYGTTNEGGPSGIGTAFRLTPAGALTTLAQFGGTSGPNRGQQPSSALVQAADGNFYGTTRSRGANDYGTVFRMTPAGVVTTLVDFTGVGGANPGSYPNATLVVGPDGNLYGTTSAGGAGSGGTIFRLTPAGTLTTLVELPYQGATNGGRTPQALVVGPDGNFYGTTSSGGSYGYGGGRYGAGIAFRMTPDGTLTTLVEFTGNGMANRGASSTAALLLASDGNFYGTTRQGGASDAGTVFRLTPKGVLTTLVDFTGNGLSDRGKYPAAELIQGADGHLYGTTAQGGVDGRGTIFRVTLAGVLTTLKDLGADTANAGAPRGRAPAAALAQEPGGDFLGTTESGGATGDGTIFRITRAGAVTTLLEFTGIDGANRGSCPQGELVQGPDGAYYGTTANGGANGLGTVFRLSPAGTLTTLVDFAGVGSANRGAGPAVGLTLGPDGSFYGTTQSGGAVYLGTVFRLSPDGQLTTLVEFTGNGGSARGSYPLAPLLLGSDGNFYGTTSAGGNGVASNGFPANAGTLFRLTPAGAFTTLVDFTGTTGARRGLTPTGRLAQGSDGNFYGTTKYGGTLFGPISATYGSIFRLTPGGALSTIYEFPGSNGGSGSGPTGGLVQGSDGSFYGTTSYGGYFAGTVYRVTPAGVATTLVQLSAPDSGGTGGYPLSGLIRGSDGSFYGTTSRYGALAGGTVYRLRFAPDGTSTQLVSVAVEPANGTRVRWKTAAGQVSRVEASADLAAPWQTAGTVTADANGIAEYLDSNASAPTRRFYRLVTPP